MGKLIDLTIPTGGDTPTPPTPTTAIKGYRSFSIPNGNIPSVNNDYIANINSTNNDSSFALKDPHGSNNGHLELQIKFRIQEHQDLLALASDMYGNFFLGVSQNSPNNNLGIWIKNPQILGDNNGQGMTNLSIDLNTWYTVKVICKNNQTDPSIPTTKTILKIQTKKEGEDDFTDMLDLTINISNLLSNADNYLFGNKANIDRTAFSFNGEIDLKEVYVISNARVDGYYKTFNIPYC